MTCVGQRERDQGGVEPGVSQGALDEAEIDTGFEERGRVSMSEGMDGHTGFGDTGPPCGCTEGPLDAVSTHGRSGGSTVLLIPPGGRKEPEGVVGGGPGGAEQTQSIFGQGDVAVFGPLAAVDMALEALTVDVGTLQGECCVEPQSQTGNGREVNLVVLGCGGREETSDLLDTEDGGEAVFGVGAHERQRMPVTLQDVLGEKPDAAVADPHGSWGELIDSLSVQAGGRQRGCGEHVWGLAIALREETDCSDIGVLGTLALATELQCGNHLLTQWGHGISPFVS